jgi:hypothetical protein
MRATVDLKVAFAIIGRLQSEAPSQHYRNIDVSIDEQQRGRDTLLIIARNEILEDLADFN